MTGSKMKIPPKLIVLDLIGVLFMGAGIMDMRKDGGIDAIVYCGLGFLLMIPLISHIFKSIPSGRNQ